jgi:hypothetical protein
MVPRVSVGAAIALILSYGLVSAASRPRSAGQSVARAAVRGPGSRMTVVLSDMHMGPGRDSAGRWYPSEDFRWPDELEAFLNAVTREGAAGGVDLILNGDTFELLQSPSADCPGSGGDLGCTEAQAVARFDRVLKAHRAEMSSIGRFARAGSNRVVVLAGDHDAALLLTAARRRLESAVAAPGRVDVPVTGDWLSVDGRIHAEHGHQIPSDPYRLERWPSPLAVAALNGDRSGASRLHRSIGEQTVQLLFDRLEARFPIVDNVAFLGTGLKYVLAVDNEPETRPLVPGLLRYFLTLMPWQQFRMDLDGGETEPPLWDLARVRSDGAAVLVAAIPDDDPFKKAASSALAAGSLTSELDRLSDEQVVAICDYRAAVRRARRRMEAVLTQISGSGPAVQECPRTPQTRGSTFDYFWRSRDRRFGAHLTAVERRLQRPLGSIAVSVHGHTHLPDRSQARFNDINGGYDVVPEGFSPVRGAFSPVVIDGGAWQRTITPVQLDRLAAARGIANAALLESLQPEDLPACYSFVLIPPAVAGGGALAPAVRYWRRNLGSAGNGGAGDNGGGGDWAIAASCGG